MLCPDPRQASFETQIPSTRRVVCLAAVPFLATIVCSAPAAHSAPPPSKRVNVASPALGAKVEEDRVWVSPTGREQDARIIQSLWIRLPRVVRIDFVRLPYVHQPNDWTRVFDPDLFLDNYPLDYEIQFSPDDGRTLKTLFAVRNQPPPYPLAKHWIEQWVQPVVTNNLRILITRSAKNRFPYLPTLSRTPEVWGTFPDGILPEFPATCRGGEPSPCADQAMQLAPSPGESPSPEISRPAAAGPGAQELSVREERDSVTFESGYLKMAFSKTAPRLLYLAWDGLGERKLGMNFLDDKLSSSPVLETFDGSFVPDAGRVSWGQDFIRYQNFPMGGAIRADITFKIAPRSFSLEVVREALQDIPAFETAGWQFRFDASRVPIQVLALSIKRGPVGQCRLPAVIHAVDQGALRVTVSDATDSGKLQVRGWVGERAVTVGLLGPEEGTPKGFFEIPRGTARWGVNFEVTTISPMAERLSADPALRSIRRGWLNALGYRPEYGALGLNAMRDVNRMCIYMYADIAAFTPELAPGFKATDLVRQSLESFMAGLPTYDGDIRKYYFADALPSMLIATWDYVVGAQDFEWLKTNWPKIDQWARELESMDRDGSGLIASLRPGISGNWRGPALWLDAINFGHQDAYSNALAYRAFRGMSQLARRIGRSDDADHFERRAERLRQAYRRTFWNPQTGLIAGWRSSDGALHDYQFVFINGIAVAYGLLDPSDGNEVIRGIARRLEDLHYDRYDLGLPVNLLPIARSDYAPNTRGAPLDEDGSDTYQYYFNGATTPFFTYWYVQALYSLGRTDEADRLLFSLLRTIEKGRGGFERGILGEGAEWLDWQGVPTGGEGFMADSYHFLLSIFTGYLRVELTPDNVVLGPGSRLNPGAEKKYLSLDQLEDFLR